MRRGRAVAGLAMIGVAVVIFTGWSPWSWAAPWSTTEQREELAAGITAVRMDVGSGDVMIRTGDRPQASVTAHVRTWWWRNGDPAYRRNGNTLVLTGCRGCSVDYELVVPRGTTVSGDAGSGTVLARGVREVDVELGSGDIRVREVSGAVDARTGSGDVTLVRVAGPVDVQSSSGSISGSGLAGPVVADTSSGDVALELTRAQEVRASTSSGDVDLMVPAGRYRVDTGDDDEGADIEVVDDPDARYALELDTSSGDIAVRAR
jgi:hypothetical protein